MKEGEDYDVVWSGSDPLLPPRASRSQIPMPMVREKRMYNRRMKEVSDEPGTEIHPGEDGGDRTDARLVDPFEGDE